MAGKENVVQGAIVAALEVYCDRNWIGTDLFAPYANQQGAALNKYCADLLVKLSTSKVILLEIKELDGHSDSATKTLPSYNQIQHLRDWEMESRGLPIRYAYALVDDLSYLHNPRERQWPNSTLLKVHLCRPSELFGSKDDLSDETPDIQEHSNLLEWLLQDQTSSSAASSAELIHHLLKLDTVKLRNQILILASVMPVGNRVMTISVQAAKEILGSAEGLDDALRSLSHDLPPEFLAAAQSVLASITNLEGKRATTPQQNDDRRTSIQERARMELERKIENRVRQQAEEKARLRASKSRKPSP